MLVINLHNINQTDDHNRIILTPLSDYEDCQGDFINASFIDVSPESLNDCINLIILGIHNLQEIHRHSRFTSATLQSTMQYIHTTTMSYLTGPKKHLLVDFWRLIWQEKPAAVVMVTNLKEGNKRKCEQYWPDTGSKMFGPFKVTLTQQQVFADYCTRTMQVTVSTIRHT